MVHRINSKLRLSTVLVITTFACGLAGAGTGAIIDVRLTPALRKYCHIVGFPQGWKILPFDNVGERLTIGLTLSDYEFRVEGLLSTWFLVGAFTPDVTDRHYDATNHYRVNFSDPTARVLPASAEDWKAATTIPLIRTFQGFDTLEKDKQVVFNGFRFTKTGAWWPGPASVSRLSPDSAWIVFQSITDNGTSKLTLRSTYRVFLDVFSADTGGKVVTMEGTYSDIGDSPGSGLRKTAWLTERYFIVPLGEHRERCLVCEFAARIGHEGAKPQPDAH
jgi:hypothetical protein